MANPKTSHKHDELTFTGEATSKVHVIAVDDTEEQLVECTASVITDVTLTAAPVVVEVVGHAFTTGDRVLVYGIVGTEELNGRWFYVEPLTVDTVALYARYQNGKLFDAIDGTAYTAYTSDGVMALSIPVTSVAWLGDTGNASPAQIGKPGDDPPTTDSPPPGFILRTDTDDLARLVAIGKAGDRLRYWYFTPK
jgi:hypothetical protein